MPVTSKPTYEELERRIRELEEVSIMGKRTQEALRESETRFKQLIESSPMAMYETDANGDCLYVNKKWCDIAGTTAEDARGCLFR